MANDELLGEQKGTNPPMPPPAQPTETEKELGERMALIWDTIDSEDEDEESDEADEQQQNTNSRGVVKQELVDASYQQEPRHPPDLPTRLVDPSERNGRAAERMDVAEKQGEFPALPPYIPRRPPVDLNFSPWGQAVLAKRTCACCSGVKDAKQNPAAQASPSAANQAGGESLSGTNQMMSFLTLDDVHDRLSGRLKAKVVERLQPTQDEASASKANEQGCPIEAMINQLAKFHLDVYNDESRHDDVALANEAFVEIIQPSQLGATLREGKDTEDIVEVVREEIASIVAYRKIGWDDDCQVVPAKINMEANFAPSKRPKQIVVDELERKEHKQLREQMRLEKEECYKQGKPYNKKFTPRELRIIRGLDRTEGWTPTDRWDRPAMVERARRFFSFNRKAEKLEDDADAEMDVDGDVGEENQIDNDLQGAEVGEDAVGVAVQPSTSFAGGFRPRPRVPPANRRVMLREELTRGFSAMQIGNESASRALIRLIPVSQVASLTNARQAREKGPRPPRSTSASRDKRRTTPRGVVGERPLGTIGAATAAVGREQGRRQGPQLSSIRLPQHRPIPAPPARPKARASILRPEGSSHTGPGDWTGRKRVSFPVEMVNVKYYEMEGRISRRASDEPSTGIHNNRPTRYDWSEEDMSDEEISHNGIMLPSRDVIRKKMKGFDPNNAYKPKEKRLVETTRNDLNRLYRWFARTARAYLERVITKWFIGDSLLERFNDENLSNTFFTRLSWPTMPQWLIDAMSEVQAAELDRELKWRTATFPKQISTIFVGLGLDLLYGYHNRDKAATLVCEFLINLRKLLEHPDFLDYELVCQRGSERFQQGDEEADVEVYQIERETTELNVTTGEYERVLFHVNKEVHHYGVKLVVLTIPEKGHSHFINLLHEFNVHLRDFVEGDNREGPKDIPIKLLDWAKLVHAYELLERGEPLVEELADYYWIDVEKLQADFDLDEKGAMDTVEGRICVLGEELRRYHTVTFIQEGYQGEEED